jgi:hypothetical protein
VIAGFGAAVGVYGGVLAVVIPDNIKAIVERAHATEPRSNDAFREYAATRSFVSDRPGSAALVTRACFIVHLLWRVRREFGL